MDSIAVRECPQCGAPWKRTGNTCEFCGAELIVRSLGRMGSFDRRTVKKYMTAYEKRLAEGPNCPEIGISLGLCYLDLGLHDLAASTFDRLVRQVPDQADLYYYLALSLVKGERPGLLTLNEIRQIEEYLGAAVTLNEGVGHYYFVLALVKYDYYVKNGLLVRPPSIEDLAQEAGTRGLDMAEARKILELVPVSSLPPGFHDVLGATEPPSLSSWV